MSAETDVYFNGHDYFCRICGEAAEYDDDTNLYHCPACREENDDAAEPDGEAAEG